MNPKTKVVQDDNRVAAAELEWTELDEVSPVTRGDNPDADVMLLKAKRDKEAADAVAAKEAKSHGWLGKMKAMAKRAKDYLVIPRSLDQIMMAQAFQDEFRELRWALSDAMGEAMACGDPSQMADMMKTNAEQFARRVSEMLAKVGATDAAKGKELIAVMDKIVMEAKAFHDSEGAAEKIGSLALSLEALEVFTFATAQPIAPQPTQEEAPPMDPKNATKSAETIAFEERMKKLEERDAQREKELAEARQEAKDAKSKSNALEADVIKLREDKASTLFTEKAKAYPALPNTKKLAGVIKAAFGVSAEAGADLEEILVSAQALSEKAAAIIMQAKGASGRPGDDDGDDDSPMGKLNAMAKEYLSNHPELTLPEARAAVAKANPVLKKLAIRQNDEALKRGANVRSN